MTCKHIALPESLCMLWSWQMMPVSCTQAQGCQGDDVIYASTYTPHKSLRDCRQTWRRIVGLDECQELAYQH